MITEYHCPKCGVNFSEDGLPNINKIHRRCGSFAIIVRHTAESKEDGSN